MEQGLRVLIHLVLEFAPAIANLVQKRGESGNLALGDISTSTEVGHFLDVIRNSLDQDDRQGEYERQKNLQMQLAVYQRQTQLELATQTREMTLKLPEVDRILDSWPLRLYPSQILASPESRKRTPLKNFFWLHLK